MIKKCNIIVGLLLISGAIFAQKGNYTLKGQLPDASFNGNTVYLQSLDYKNLGEPNEIDITSVVDGKFMFTGIAPNIPEIRIITISNGDLEKDIFAFFVAEEGNVDMQISDEKIELKGTPNNTKHELLQQKLQNYYQEFTVLKEQAAAAVEQNAMDDATIESITAVAKEIMSRISETVFDYSKENMQNGIGEFYFVNYASQFTLPQMIELHEASRQSFRDEPAIVDVMQKYVWSQDGVTVGTKFKGIALENLAGESQDMNDYIGKGKVVLIDFWASWCMPCIQEMPGLVRLYSEQKNNGFEIIGVSLDESASKWKSSLQSMNMTWPQFLDNGWNGKAAQQYGITRIPQTFILDREGTIVAKDLRGKELEAKIIELLTQ